MFCEICGNEEITYYRQQRVDGVWVVVARCEQGHKPEKRRPFYPTIDFDVMSLPILNHKPEITNQEITTNIDEFFSLDIIEQRRQTFEHYKRNFPDMKSIRNDYGHP